VHGTRGIRKDHASESARKGTRKDAGATIEEASSLVSFGFLRADLGCQSKRTRMPLHPTQTAENVWACSAEEA
jgi:hypothetical protein